MRSEFEFIQNIKEKYRLDRIGDDCAVLPKDADTDLVITADLLVEEIDFRLEWTTPEALGHKALAISLSDIAAMGAAPKWAMLSIGVPEALWSSDFIDRYYEGWHLLARQFDVEMIGGDVSRTTENVVIDSIVLGEVPKGRAVMRSGASPGDSIFVTGPLGGSAGGLRLLQNDIHKNRDLEPWQANLIQDHLRPVPRVAEGILLGENYAASSMIDLSDGLSSDLQHICDAGGVGARIYSERLPVNSTLSRLLPAEETFDLALHGGEDFELLFTGEREKILSLENGSFTRIGDVTASVGTIELIHGENIEILRPAGYRHF